MNKEDILEMLQELNEKQTETVSIETKSAKNGKPEKYYDTISSFSTLMVVLYYLVLRKQNIKIKLVLM